MNSNINVYFEDYGYAVSDMNETLNNLHKIGINKVAATGLGNFTHYEELQDLVHKKEKNDPNFEMSIIPAITVYFEDISQTLTLIAKNNQGYKSLCKIITESNQLGNIIENKDNKSANIPIVTLDNLRKNVSKNDLILTTGGISGVFFQQIYGKEYNFKQKEKQLEEQSKFHFSFSNDNIEMEYDLSYQEALDILQHYTEYINSVEKITKTQLNLAKKSGDEELYEILLSQYEKYQKIQAYKKENGPLMEALSKAMKVCAKPYRDLIDLQNDFDSSTFRDKTYQLYSNLQNIFGTENIYFEIQNHYLEQEMQGYPQFVQFIQEMNPNAKFIVGNSTRIGLLSGDPNIEKEINRINVSTFQRNKKYIKEEDNLQEYCIKSEEELIKVLQDLQISDDIITQAIQNTDLVMNFCHLEKENSIQHYPKFCEDENAEFEKLCWQGLQMKFADKEIPEEYKERLKREIQVIQKMGFSGYHLIVQDYLKYGKLLGYLTEEEVASAPWTIEDLEKYIKDNNISCIGTGIGPGRGSAAGSLCCYSLGITDIDPIKYGLLFERFLNEERVSMPDIDSDFRPDIRYKVREYVKHKYGFNNVCEIVTKSYMHSKSAIKTAARYLAAEHIFKNNIQSKIEIDKIKKTYDSHATLFTKKIDELDRLGQLSVPELKAYFKEHNEVISDQTDVAILNLAETLEGTFDGYGQHAAGSIIADCDISDEMPLMWNSSSGSLETQCQNAQSEARGFLKMDFLGLINLTVITDVIQNPSDKNLLDVFQDIHKREAAINDPKIFSEIYSKGLTQGIFQVESPGMKDMLKKFKPKNIDDVILLIAAYRPGPLDYIPEIIASKWYDEFGGDYEKYSTFIKTNYPFSDKTYKENKAKGIAYFYDENGNVLPEKQHSISLKNDTLSEILKNTYGCPIYQEQIMEIFQKMAGYTLGRSDEVRRAMSKKKVDVLEHERKIFLYGNHEEIEKARAEGKPIPHEIKGCIALHNLSEFEANQLFDQMMPFAKYGFNKSHAAAYTVVSCMTAWLKLYKTADFYRSALNIEDISTIPLYAEEFKEMGVQLLPPSLNKQNASFEVENGNIRFPIARSKGFNKQNMNLIPSNSLFGFIYNNPTVSKAVIKKLIYMGCFDSCWQYTNPSKQQLEIQRTNHNASEMMAFLDKYYKNIAKCSILSKELKNNNLSDSDKAKKVDEFQKLKEYLLTECKNKDFSPVIASFEQRLDSRNKEFDLLNYNFHLDDLQKKIQQKFPTYSKTYENLKQKDCTMAAAVILVSESKQTKKGNPYYDVTLMDKNGELFVRRMYPLPSSEIEIFSLYQNPYFINKLDKPKYYNNNQKKDTNDYKSNIEKNIHSFQNGKTDTFHSDRQNSFEKEENEL